MRHTLNLQNRTPRGIYPLDGFSGTAPDGSQVSFTNYYMQLNGKPFYGVSGEYHFSRHDPEYWEDELIKMKQGGINVISTYIFWIHHEEEEGVFDFSGRRCLRRFVELCGSHGLYVIARIGPFDHGEVRNGGLPDWLYGKPFEVRTTQQGFLDCTARLYRELHKQMDGLYFKQGGPIIGVQLDNEYMHSAAPWEFTAGVSDEWVPHGAEGDTYMLRLLQLAKETGIDAPFYTCTGWGGAATPPELMPLWGGYAFRPWIFYSHKGEHPATEEYIYRDNHNNAVPATYNFEPFYQPESKPYLCCEMGGGMTCCYYYRFQLPYESVDAMANIKLGSGCNMLGYYMYHGGTNPTGKRVPFLNEGQMPKLSYDYQAPLGEFGQVRDSYHRLRALHLFTEHFQDILCRAETVLPPESQTIEPTDSQTLRYAVRVTPEGQGFVFLNNYQDHAPMADKTEETIVLELDGETVEFQGISLAAGENCVLPFGLEIAGIPLVSALAQPMAQFQYDGEEYAFFLAPDGMKPRYTFGPGVTVADSGEGCFTAECGNKRLTVVTLTRKQARDFYLIDTPKGKAAILTEAAVLADNGSLRLEHDGPRTSLRVFPQGALADRIPQKPVRDGLYDRYELEKQVVSMKATLSEIGSGRYTVELAPLPAGVKQALLQIRYQGDIGQAFLDGRMVNDNFSNGAVWEIGLREHAAALKEHPLTLYIAPIRQDSNVNVESVMAGRKEEISKALAKVEEVAVKLIYQWTL